MAAYIEREVVLKILKRHPCGTWRGIAMYYSDEIKAAMKDIESLPAADVAPVRHGRWIEKEEHIYLADGTCKEWTNFYCSECDAPNNAPSYFCPNCGAKMDKEE